VRVDLTRPDRTLDTVMAETDDDGRFAATFRLARGRRGARDVAAAEVPSGTYAFQAHVMGATRLAPADSNVVFLVVGKPGGEERRPAEELAYDLRRRGAEAAPTKEPPYAAPALASDGEERES